MLTSAEPPRRPPDTGFSDAQRMAFGSVAELYERARPVYPAGAIDDALGRGRVPTRGLVVEVGAGTGKATLALARRGLRVIALEPDGRMAAVLCRRCAPFPLVEVREQRLEQYGGHGNADLVLAAQSWHWVERGAGFKMAARCLRDGGALVAMWTLPRWEEVPLRARLVEVYERHAPQLRPLFPMHPGSRPDDLTGDWGASVSATAHFKEPASALHRFSVSYTPQEYGELLASHQDHILLAPAVREPLLAAVRESIDAAGGTLRMSFGTSVCSALRS